MAINYTITGTIFNEFNIPIQGIDVQAFEIDFRAEKSIGKAITDGSGAYIITFTERETEPEHKKPDVLILLTDAKNKVSEKSSIYFNIEENTVIDYRFGGSSVDSINEYDRLFALIKPMIEVKKLKFDQLEESADENGHKDISFLSGDTGEPYEQIEAMVNAHKLSVKSKMDVQFFYALIRMGQPSEMVELLQLDKLTLKNTIDDAVNANIISSAILKNLEKTIEKFKAVALKLTMHEKTSIGIENFRIITSGILKKPDTQKVFIETVYETENEPENLWEALSKKPEFKDKSLIENLKKTLEISALTGDQPALTTTLLDTLKSGNSIKSVRTLAGWNTEEWKKTILDARLKQYPDNIKGDSDDAKAENYASNLSSMFKTMFPTNYFSAHFKKDALSTFEKKKDLDTFFTKNPDFDFTAQDFIKKIETSDLATITDRDTLTKNIKTIHRIHKLAGNNYEAISAMKNDGLDSAASIVRKYGSKTFTEKYSSVFGKEDVTLEVFKKAVSLDKKTTAILIAHQTSNDIITPVTHNLARTGEAATSEPIEGYYEMFSDGELCDCAHCQSVYSPAAYFVDMLNYLRKENTDAYDKLIERRPDLEHILLTCKNTNTPLPYIDLVNELLEKYVVFINSGSNDNSILTSSYQTETDTERLDAIPEHSNPEAYLQIKNVASGKSAFTDKLPFDEPLEQIKLYVEKLGWTQYDFIKQFSKVDTPSIDQLSMAYAWFGASVSAWKIVSGEQVLAIDYDTVDHRLDTLLTYMRISYQELQKLLECKFVNPNSTIKIEQETNENNVTCNLEKLFLTNISPEWLNKAARFMRLWKITGWDIYDVDRTLKALGKADFPTPGNFNDELLLPFYQVDVVRKEMKLTISQVLVFTSKIDKDESYRDFSKEGNAVHLSLYQLLFGKDPVKALNTDLDLSENLEIIAAAFNVPTNEILSIPDIGDNTSSLTNLSKIYRQVLMAKYLNVPIAEFHKMLDITKSDMNVEDTWSLQDVVKFLSDAKFLKSIGLETDRIITLSNTTEETNEIIKLVFDLFKKIDFLTNNPIGASFEESFKVSLNQLIDFLSSNTILSGSLSEEVKNIQSIFSVITNQELDKLIKLTLPEVEQLQANLKEHLRLIPTSKILTYFNFSNEDLLWIKENSPTLKIIDFWEVEVKIDTADLFLNLKQLYFLSQLSKRKRLVSSAHHWKDLVAVVLDTNETKEAFTEKVEEIYGIKNHLVDQFLEISNVTYPTDLSQLETLVVVLDRSESMAKLSPSTNQAKSLLTSEPTAEDAEAVLNLLKAKYTQPEWLKIIQPINDKLRKKRRDALVSWLIGNSAYGWENATDIYKYLLIDTEMESCMDTSRIKQAIGSVQLFIDRCLMGLEQDITTDEDFAKQWNSWRKQYRVWEANRKIFLYPENWLEPELRDDRSPFFRELESQLTQNEVTDEIAKEALINYLQKLDAVAKLEIVGFFNDETTGKLHVFGRTHNIPQQYFYRYQYKEVWSAWEKVELDIEGDHILPVVWNGRLMLFWAQFTEKQQNNGKTTITGAADNMTMNSTEGRKYYEMKLVWSEYKNGRWGGKKVSNCFILIFATQVGFSGYEGNGPLHIIDYILEKDKVLITSSIQNDNKIKLHIYQDKYDWNEQIEYISSFNFDHCLGSPFISREFEHEVIYSLPNTKTSNNSIKIDAGNLRSLSFYKNVIFRKKKLEPTESLLKKVQGSDIIKIKVNNVNSLSAPTAFFLGSNFNYYISCPWDFKEQNEILQSTFSKSIDFPFGKLPSNRRYYTFNTFQHKFVCSFIKILYTQGIDNLYDQANQKLTSDNFITDFQPTSLVKKPYPKDDIDYSMRGSYAQYNWELFFHIPITIAYQLINNQKYDEARKWLHYIFNPTIAGNVGEGAERFWVPRVFKEEIGKMVSLEALLQDDKHKDDLQIQVENWEDNPFNPHAVARYRLSAYMRKTYLLYIDNLIKWGDSLFVKDTIESINEATLLYVLASEILGERQQVIPKRAELQPKSFNDIKNDLDPFSNVKLEVETYLTPGDNSEDILSTYYFGIPRNEYILKYWDTIEDRLYKIRHCMNIQGIVRSLALFEPPLDPAMLIRMRGAGLTINDVVDQSYTLPNSRFYIMLQKANELCNDVKNLGSSILSAIEKRDSEQLSLLRSTHELNMLALVKRQKEMQRDEAEENLGSLNDSKKSIEKRIEYYTSRSLKNKREERQLKNLDEASTFQDIQSANEFIASVLFSIPDVKIGAWSWGTETGGTHFAGASKSISAAAAATSAFLISNANIAGIEGGYERRMDDWKFQAQTAEIELKQIDKQIAAAEIRLAMTEQDLVNHERQTEQSREVDDFMRSKFSNAELYSWMVEQSSNVYFQTYNLAYATAKKAEVCMQHELGIENMSLIQFGYWDSLKKGLLSGEKLQYALRALENAYLEQNTREHEITKHISLAMLDPMAIIALKQTGTCKFEIPEVLFDLDFPGHYRRRIKSVSISIPCIAGPYTSVNATLSLKESKYRKSLTVIDSNSYPDNSSVNFPDSDVRFKYFNGSAIQSIATSHGQNDSGVFELNFRDDRYLPFEGRGAISKWELDLPSVVRQFDYNTISDVIVHIKYTSSDGGYQLKNVVNTSLRDQLRNIKQGLEKTGLHIALNLKHDLPNDWNQFKKNGTIGLTIDKFRLPYLVQSLNPTVNKVVLLIKSGDQQITINVDSQPSALTFEPTILMNICEITDSNLTSFDKPIPIQVDEALKNTIKEFIVIIAYKIT